MQNTIKSNKFISLIMAVIFVLSSFAVVGNMGTINAYASSLAKTTVTLTNSSPTSIKVSFTKVSGATKYTVYSSTKKSSGYKALTTTKSTSYTATKLTCGKTYYFKVKAISGNSSSTSSVVSKKAVPAKLGTPTVSATCSSIKISWTKASGVSGYQIYYSTSKTGTYKKLATTSSTSYTNKSLKLSTTRYYKVRSYKKVGSNYIYGAFSSVVSKKTAHSPSTSWTVTKSATCANTGTKSNKCKYCSKTYTVTIPKDDSNHSYGPAKTIEANKEHESYKEYTCTKCGDKYTTKIKKHKEFTKTVVTATCSKKGYTEYICKDCGYKYTSDYTDTIPHTYKEEKHDVTCTEDGYTVNVCSVCGYVDESSKKDVVPSVGTNHDYGEQVKTEEGYLVTTCSRCGKEKKDTTCYIDITNQTISVPAVAEFNKSSSNTTDVCDKLDLNPDGISDYEITGDTTGLTIDVNSDQDVEIKLAGVSIVNDSKDCIDIKNKSTDETVAPEVSISAKDGTKNYLTTTVSGNAIESSCALELKGHGELYLNTVSTSINCEAKLSIKNLSLDIKSSNRGIDTKSTVTDDSGITTTSYYNIKIGANANIVINSADDCIRCKNMEIYELQEDEIGTVMNLTSTDGDGIQLEGNTGLTANSGTIIISAGKYAFNCKADKVVSNGAVINASGKSGTYKA
jgi:fibronectin type 3 domain-containing protein